MNRTSRMISLALAALLASGCYGSFNLTRQVYHWNSQVGDKWPREFMFLVLTWVPVYGIAGLGDAVVFNSIEFWSGKNPVEAPKTAAAPQIKHLVRGTDEIILAYSPISEAGALFIDQYREGRPAASLHIHRHGGMTVGSDTEGHVMLTAQTLADGGILIRDGSGKQMANYSADQVNELLGAAGSE